MTKIDPVSLLAAQATSPKQGENVSEQFDAMFYRMMLQEIDFTAGIAGHQTGYAGMYREMLTDFLSQEIAKQQSGYGAMLLNTTTNGDKS